METQTNNQRGLITYIRVTLKRLLTLLPDKAPEAETIESIKGGVDFHGAKLWILIMAIFVASLGLNTNSAAVIIGAMLISPLMGPIMGLGLGVGINDFELFKRSFRSFSIATLFSVLTATLYFVVTPIAEAQSELLARTFPTIYDVLIAFCGGMAGIIALCTTSQRTGNVIPGVAIATALMPPLCTTGFGLATGNWAYAAGAFYLYLINTIFISLATFLGVNIMHFRKKVFVDKERERRVKRIIASITVLTMLPATILTFGLVRETIFTRNANQFITNELSFEGSQIVAREISFPNRHIKVILLGDEVSEKALTHARGKLESYNLEKAELEVVQGANSLEAEDVRKLINSHNGVQSANAELLAENQRTIQHLNQELAPYKRGEQLSRELRGELQTLFPQVKTLSLCRGMLPAADTTKSARALTLVWLETTKQFNIEDRKRLNEWLHVRIASSDSLHFVWETIE